MQKSNSFPRVILFLALMTSLLAGISAPALVDESVSAAPMGASALDVIISEVAWGGTAASSTDEWIELYNATSSAINLSGWTLVSNEVPTPSPNITLTGTIPAGGYYLLERTDDNTVSDLLANQIYTGALNDTGETLTLYDNLNNPIDTANGNGATWPAGTNDINRYSMERNSISIETDASWTSNNGVIRNGLDAGIPSGCTPSISCTTNPQPINGTPKQQNSAIYSPLMLLINEVAWAGTLASSDDEWIELYNPGSTAMDLDTGWRLISSDGSPNIDFSTVTCSTPNCTIPSGGFFLLERDTEGVTNIIADLVYTGALANGGETLTLYSPSNDVIDTANGNGGPWPAGNTTTFSTMERIGTLHDSDSAWFTNNGVMKNGLDYNEDPIFGTPKNGNSPTPTPTATITLTPSNTPTSTPTLTLTPTITTTPAGLRSVIINEIAWAGTVSGLSNDEWIELYNPGNTPVDISGWSLSTGDGDPNIIILFGTSIPAGGYYLLERDDDNTVSDVTADQIYTGTLSNSGEILTLYDGSNKVIDTANGNGGSWPAGSSSTYGTMERISGTADSDSAWHTNTGTKKNGENANGGDILGTPKNSNSSGPTPTPARTPTKTRTPTPFPIDPHPLINEILPRPGFDWNQDGRVDVFDEFIEIKNLSPIDINLSGWKLDDEANTGSSPYTLPDITLKPGQRRVFYGSQTNILLSDGGDSVRLINPNGKIYDAYAYSIAKKADQSICRLPDGNVYGAWYEDCTPTPNLTNTREGVVPSMPGVHYESPVCELPDTLPADFFFAECHGYGENIWNSFFWDQSGWLGAQNIPQNMSKWEVFIR